MSVKNKEQEEIKNSEQENLNQIEEQELEKASENEEVEVSEVEKLQEELEKEKDKFLRLFAEFENYKKRTLKERLELSKTASQDVMQSMLPIIDDFDRALVEINKSKDKNLIKGVELISHKFRETLRNKGLEPIAVKAGDVFDADIHDAITQIPAPEDKLKGKIVDVVETGYTLGDKIIRFPKVVIGK
ncbi:nucleotide exchange factor GrpE [Mesonia sp. K7]|uniref:nucleotide exchange factor GrpE n=1 Tax=Mesonia sp. K7 TaxID=2218606 RepID=UPI000DA959F3|nr:nucleotide exchange factor GrpE [Mesonia sp. K7]PZD79540.1 nucleotide exchange factor GrpE [Mesonia sp. K7]